MSPLSKSLSESNNNEFKSIAHHHLDDKSAWVCDAIIIAVVVVYLSHSLCIWHLQCNQLIMHAENLSWIKCLDAREKKNILSISFKHKWVRTKNSKNFETHHHHAWMWYFIAVLLREKWHRSSERPPRPLHCISISSFFVCCGQLSSSSSLLTYIATIQMDK